MKIRDIVVREDDGTGTLTTKPLPGAQQIIAPDGKAIGTADQATADAMKAAAEKGTLTLGGDEQQTSEEQDGEEDLVRHGNGDVGGDGTDQFIHDVKMHNHSDTVDEAPETDGPGYSFDSAAGFKAAISKELGSQDPELNAQIDQLVVAEPDGTVDVDQTLYNMIDVVNSQVLPSMLQFVNDMIAKFTELSKSPEFAQVSPADQASVLQSIKDMQASLPKLQQQVADTNAEFEKNKPMMQQNIKDRKMNTQLKGAPPAPTPMSESDRELLGKMRMIAGLK